MTNQAVNKFEWVISNFFSLKGWCYSLPFVIGDCKWRLVAFLQLDKVGYYPLYLEVYDCKSLPSGWRRHTKVRLSIVDQGSKELSLLKETQQWFDEEDFYCKFIFSNTNDGLFHVDGRLKIVAEVDVLEVIEKLDVLEESEETTQCVRDIVEYNDVPDSIGLLVDVNGFQILPYQVNSVIHLFEKHPDIVSEVRPTNRHLKTAYMNMLLGLIETLCQPPQELSKDDLNQAHVALVCLMHAGFKVDWLEKTLEQVSERKNKEEAIKVWMEEMEEKVQQFKEQELSEMKRKWSDMEALMQKEKAELSNTKAYLSFDDIV